MGTTTNPQDDNNPVSSSKILKLVASLLQTLKSQRLNSEFDQAQLALCLQVFDEIASIEATHWQLTPRQTEIWKLKRSGHSYAAIAQHLFISTNTVKKHLKDIVTKKEFFEMRVLEE